MIERYLAGSIESLCLVRHKIAMISGPRQSGKTTLARMILKERTAGRYCNWDEAEFRRAWTKAPSLLLPAAKTRAKPLLVLDEIHKDRLWKRNLKGLYDTHSSDCDFLVTGSARLNVFRRGSDSLLGRFLHFRLHPFSLREMSRGDVMEPDDLMKSLFNRALERDARCEKDLDALMRFGPFPEPLFSRNERAMRLWRNAREQAVIREDLRDLSRLPDLGRLEMMTSLIPERVGSPFSVASIREDMEVSFDTIRRWMTWLKELYYLFELKPFSRRIARSLKREGKVYLWDFGVIKNEAARFENLVALHLLKTCHYWTDTGAGNFDLHYLRNKEKQEIDFLITRDGEPWLPVEVKLSDETPSPNWKKFLPLLGCDRGLQIVRHPARRSHKTESGQILVVGAAEALFHFA